MIFQYTFLAPIAVLADGKNFNNTSTYPLDANSYFVRDCYKEYYENVVSLLEAQDLWYISVTRTPGIGKSMFYVYFFHRFTKENPNSKIVTASFSKERKLEKGVVFSGGINSNKYAATNT